MAGNQSSDKTEEPTQKKINDSRKKGQVAKSQELGSVATLLGVVITFAMSGDWIQGSFTRLVLTSVQVSEGSFQELLPDIATRGFQVAAGISLTLAGVAAIAALLINYAQVGTIFAPEAIQPKFSNVSPTKKLKNIFSKDSVIELLKSITKIVVLGAMLVLSVSGAITQLFGIISCELGCIIPIFASVLKNILVYALIVFVVVAAIDFFLKKQKYKKDLMMTKQEVKQEYKEAEGDPHVKGMRKQLAKEIATSQQRDNVKRSTVVVTNPTHVAIGIYYDDDKTPLPIVTFKEEGHAAARMVKFAKEEGIPVMQNVPLARSLLEQSMLENYIPSELIAPVAEVLRVVGGLK